jgi:hypothetical protein
LSTNKLGSFKVNMLGANDTAMGVADLDGNECNFQIFNGFKPQ